MYVSLKLSLSKVLRESKIELEMIQRCNQMSRYRSGTNFFTIRSESCSLPGDRSVSNLPSLAYCTWELSLIRVAPKNVLMVPEKYENNDKCLKKGKSKQGLGQMQASHTLSHQERTILTSSLRRPNYQNETDFNTK